jgi:hypothetical protein
MIATLSIRHMRKSLGIMFGGLTVGALLLCLRSYHAQDMISIGSGRAGLASCRGSVLILIGQVPCAYSSDIISCWSIRPPDDWDIAGLPEAYGADTDLHHVGRGYRDLGSRTVSHTELASVVARSPRQPPSQQAPSGPNGSWTLGGFGYAWREFPPSSMRPTRRFILLPWWFIVCTPASAWVLVATRSFKQVWRKSRKSCAACGYDMRATPDRCPECGRASGQN